MGDSFSDANPLPGAELAAFVAAVESGSIQGSAEALDLTQSAATKRVQSLERRLSGELLVRGAHGTRPTELGLAIYPLAKRALEALAEVGRAADQQARAGARMLRLSASLTTGEFLVPGWLGEFRTLRPDVQAQLEVVNSSAVAKRVADGVADIGFVEGRDQLESFQKLTVAHDRLLVVVAAGHRWSRRRSVAAAELAAEPYFTRERLSGTREVVEGAMNGLGLTLSPALELASLQSLKRTIAHGGYTIISALTIEAEQRAGSLVGIPIRGLELGRELQAIRRPGRRRPEAASALWAWLEQRTSAAREVPAPGRSSGTSPGQLR